MQTVSHEISSINWELVAEDMHQKGFALLPKLLTDEQCEILIANYNDPTAYRKTVVMERHRFGLGEYKYFNYPLPELIQEIRTATYPQLAPIANVWFRALGIDTRFPNSHAELLDQCRENDQHKATVLILKYGKGGFNTLHQDLYGDVYFPMQIALFLNEPDEDYTGGEFCTHPANTKSPIQGHRLKTPQRRCADLHHQLPACQRCKRLLQGEHETWRERSDQWRTPYPGDYLS